MDQSYNLCFMFHLSLCQLHCKLVINLVSELIVPSVTNPLETASSSLCLSDCLTLCHPRNRNTKYHRLKLKFQNTKTNSDKDVEFQNIWLNMHLNAKYRHFSGFVILSCLTKLFKKPLYREHHLVFSSDNIDQCVTSTWTGYRYWHYW